MARDWQETRVSSRGNLRVKFAGRRLAPLGDSVLTAPARRAHQRASSAAARSSLAVLDCEAFGERWSRFPEQNGGLAKVEFGFDYAANFSSFACVA